MVSSRVLALILTLGPLAGALRTARRSSSNLTKSESGRRGFVSNLVTYGAPQVSAPAVKNPKTSDGCFSGYRVVNEGKGSLSGSTYVDMVPTLLTPTSYEHVLMPVMKVGDKFAVTKHPCGWVGEDFAIPWLPYHFMWEYYAMEVVPGIEEYTAVGLRPSYNSDVYDVMKDVAKWGYNVLGSAQFDVFLGTQVSYLMKKPATGQCIVTFQGSDSVSDFIDDALVVRVPFCGLPEKFHYGFRKALLEMVSSDSWQSQVRSNLQYCSSVDVVGHSLGGAMAAMFSACANHEVAPGAEGYDDWKWMHFA